MWYLVGICKACGRLLVKYLSLDPGLGSSGDMGTLDTHTLVTHAVTMRADNCLVLERVISNHHD